MSSADDRTKSTPTPWKQSVFMGVGPRGEKIFHCGLGLRGPAFSSEQEANAEFIVRACNAHAGLTAALARARQYVAADQDGDGSARRDCLRQIDEAIAQSASAK